MASRLIHSSASRFLLSKPSHMTAWRNARYFSSESNKIDEPFKVEEAETVNLPPREKILVLGGNGFVGSHICKEALERGLAVASLNRGLLKEDAHNLTCVS
ncbi:unnamed protein product [Cuscuta campestris]|uniref:NAD-dependent epimerase/dehydratase domain-containing protein n=1 Tax=Cuscuta campestris TaxID=132261 RepID=A0A484NPN0_9ASTE|nr:unnamed protein product [Cuscuta campestris]